MEWLVALAIAALGAWLYWKRHTPAFADPQHYSAGAPSKPNLQMLPARFVVFDLETTGLDPARHQIIEIGAIRVSRDSNLHDTFQTLVSPTGRTGRLSARVTELTGLDRATLLKDGIPLPEALDAFRDFVGELPLVAFNADFDVSFIQAAAKQTGRPPFLNAVSCALQMAREAWPGKRSYRLASLCREAGIAVEAEHRAIPDCERALRVYVAAAQTLGRA